MTSTAIQKKKEKIVKPENTLLTQSKIDNLITRINVAIDPFVTKQKDLRKAIARLVIKDQKSYDKAGELYDDIKENSNGAVAVVEDMVTLANSLHKGLTGVRKSVTELGKTNQDELAAKLRPFEEWLEKEQARKDEEARVAAEEKERKDREARELKAAEERKAAEDEAERKRQEQEKADKLAEEARTRAEALEEGLPENATKEQIAEAKEAKRKARQAEEVASRAKTATMAAEHRVEEKAEIEEIAVAERHDPIDVGHVTAAPVMRSNSAPSWVDNWKGRCDNFEVLVKYIAGIPVSQPFAHLELVALIQVNQSKLDDMGSAQKENLKIPGCVAWNDKFMRGSKRR